MATMLHLDSPSMRQFARGPSMAEKENAQHRQPPGKPSASLGKAGTTHGKGGKQADAVPRMRMALKTVNGDNLSSPALPPAAAKKPSDAPPPLKTPGRAALSNLTNQHTGPSSSSRAGMKTPSLAPIKAPKASSALKHATKRTRAPLSAVADIEQPYPKRVAPVVDDVPRLPRQWHLALPRDIWSPRDGPAGCEDPLDLSVSLEAVPLEEPLLPTDDDERLSSPVLLLDGLGEADEDLFFVSDLHRDLAEDAKNLAAELLSFADDAGSSLDL